MIEIPTPENGSHDLEIKTRLPAALPVLPLKDSVPFPETLTPLAVGQERSIKLVNDVLGGDRMLVMAASRSGDIEEPGPEDLYDVGVAGTVARMIKVPDGTLRILVHGAQRVRLTDYVQSRALPDREGRGAARQGVSELRAGGAVPQRPEHLQRDHRAGALSARGTPGGGGQPGGPGRAGAHDRRRAADQDRGAPGAAGAAGRGPSPAAPVRAAGPRVRADLHRHQDPVAGGVRDGEGPARVLPAPAAQGHPGGAWRGGRAGGRGPRAARADRRRRPAAARPQAGRARAAALRAPAAAGRRARRDPQLPGVAGHAAVVAQQRGPHRSQTGPQDPGPRPLRHGEGQGPDPGVPGGAQAQARRQELDPVLRGPPGRGQDQPGQVDRLRHGPRVRAHQRRRRARRVRDPRPPPHVHRRHAGHDHARDARRRHRQPGAHDRRDRQDGRRLPRRPLQRHARGAGPRAELQLPRPLPGPAVRPVEGPVHHHRQPAGPDPRAAARPDGGDRALGLHRGGEAGDRQALPGAAPDGAERRGQVEDRVHRRRRCAS